MPNASVNKVVLILLALFAILALTVIYINLSKEGKPPELEIPVDGLDVELTDKDKAIASIDLHFEPSPVIESFILLNHRGSASQVDMVQPAQDSLFKKQDINTGIQFSGNFPLAKDQISIMIKLYSNDDEAFNQGKAILVKEIQTQNNEDGIPEFTTSLNLDLSPGLYYYILESIEDELLLGGGKFRIVP